MSLLTKVLSTAAATVLAGSLTAAPAQADTVSVSPPGANDWSCKPSPAHPYPVILVPGTFERMEKNWSTLSPHLKSAGYCVFALNYGETNGVYATAPVAESAKELAPFVDAVRAATGARKVSLVGHSQGGMMPRYYMHFSRRGQACPSARWHRTLQPRNGRCDCPAAGRCPGTGLQPTGLCCMRRSAGWLTVHAEAQLRR